MTVAGSGSWGALGSPKDPTPEANQQLPTETLSTNELKGCQYCGYKFNHHKQHVCHACDRWL
jgi:hypothetical protein